MLKVECESCKAPFQIDERRIPPSGLKMRCPKCGHSFLVSAPAAGAPPPDAADAGVAQARVASPPVKAAETSKFPNLGKRAGEPPPLNAGASAGAIPRPVGSAGLATGAGTGSKSSIAGAGVPAASPLKKTMVGIAPMGSPLSAPSPLSSPFGSPLGAKPALPTAGRGAPPLPTAPPVSRAAPAAPSVAAPLPPPAAGGRSAPVEPPSDFPAALGTLDESDLPVVSGASLPAPKGQDAPRAFSVPAAPAPAGPAAATAPRGAAAPFAPPPAGPATAAPSGPLSLDDLDFDLPVVAADLPSAKGPPKGAPKFAQSKAGPPKVNSPFGGPQPNPRTPTLPDFDDLPAIPTADLPVARGAGLPAVRRAPVPPPEREAFLSDLPVRAADPASPDVDLPSLVAPDLPVVAAGLPSVAAGLPSVAAGLPSVAAALPARTDPNANLPAPAASLPVVLDSLPVPLGPPGSDPPPASARGFGEIELPTTGDSFPPRRTPPPAGAPASAFDLFGELDLPHEGSPPEARPISSAPPADLTGFGDLELDDKRRSVRPSGPAARPPATRSDAPKAAGGVNFGEVEIGGSGDGLPSIGIEAALGGRTGEVSPGPGAAAASAPARVRNAPQAIGEEVVAPKKASFARAIGVGVLLVVLAGGGALQLTPYGAFGNLAVGDVLHAADYQRAAVAAMGTASQTASPDTYGAAKAAVDAVYAAHLARPRARALTAYAAFVDSATSVRFGSDTTRGSHARQLLASLPSDKPVPYRDAALAAAAAADGDLENARKAVQAAAPNAPGDPIQLDLALLAGDLALALNDAAGAVTAFQRAAGLANDARAHFGLARAYDLLGDGANTKKELEATLAASPQHAGALTLRARARSVPAEPLKALADLAIVLDGPGRSQASPNELSNAYAAKAWVSLERGAATEARDAFAQAVTLNPNNGAALNGEGRLFLNEGRYTEALARFDTALGVDPNSPESIANDAEAKIALERLADAKQQLSAARELFPKNIPILVLLGKVEQHLGNHEPAEADLRAAIAYVDPTRPDAVLPYVALSELLSARGQMADARATLDEAKKKLTPSSALERAFGEISELQGDSDAAITHYGSALTRDPRDLSARFRLAVALRRVRRFDDAGANLDKVAAVDKDYPGLSLERGLLFEESGDVEKAIEQFNGALAKAPDDPDLQLRVGSAYVSIGRPDEALTMLHKVLDKRPTSAEAHHYIGRALMLQGGPAQVDAIRYLKRAVDLDPNRADFHVYLAWAANDATPAQLELARDEIDRALTLDKQNAEAYWQRGVLERMEGAVEDAMKDEKHALELHPSRYEAHATLAECYEDKNEDAAAVIEWGRAIAGDADAPDSTSVIHPYWRYRYGKLLMERGGAAVALAQLLPAANTATKLAQRPGWLAPLEFLTAEALRKTGQKADAIEHYKRYLEIAPVNSPDRLDAQQALASLGGNR